MIGDSNDGPHLNTFNDYSNLANKITPMKNVLILTASEYSITRKQSYHITTTHLAHAETKP